MSGIDDWVDLNAAEESDSGWTTPSCASSQPGTPRGGPAAQDDTPAPTAKLVPQGSPAIATPSAEGKGKAASTQTTGELCDAVRTLVRA